MRKFRRFMTTDELSKVYAHTYNHTRWAEHRIRVLQTIQVAQRLIDQHSLSHVTDLSCGDGAIANGLTGVEVVLGDYATNGPIERNVLTTPNTDLWIISETVEHLEAPWTVLENIATHTKWIVLTTPDDEQIEIGNYEHYWSFTQQDINDLLAQAGFVDRRCEVLTDIGWTYQYQIWTARSEVA